MWCFVTGRVFHSASLTRASKGILAGYRFFDVSAREPNAKGAPNEKEAKDG
jgi:hypothetical protein